MNYLLLSFIYPRHVRDTHTHGVSVTWFSWRSLMLSYSCRIMFRLLVRRRSALFFFGEGVCLPWDVRRGCRGGQCFTAPTGHR